MPATERLSQRLAIMGTIDPQSASAGDYETDAVDMRLFRRALFVLLVGAIATNGTLNARLQGSVNGSTGWTNISGKAIAELNDTGTDDNKQALIEITDAELANASALFRYVRLQVTTATAASLIAAAAIGGDPRYHPASDFDLSSVDEIVA